MGGGYLSDAAFLSGTASAGGGACASGRGGVQNKFHQPQHRRNAFHALNARMDQEGQPLEIEQTPGESGEEEGL